MFELGERRIAKMAEYGIPGYMQGGLIRYFENRVPPGGFLIAVLENDLVRAFDHADPQNQAAMHGYVMWLYNAAPGRPNGWGSPNAVREWLAGENYLQQEIDYEREAS